MAIDAVIFDLGNVLARFDHRRAFVTAERHLGRPIAGMAWDWFVSHSGQMHLHDYETGRIDGREFYHGVIDGLGLSGCELPEDVFERAWCDIFDLDPEVLGLAHRVAGTGRWVGIGSNTSPAHAHWVQERFAQAWGPFRSWTVSYEVGVMKPAREFYVACLRSCGHPAERCLFIDDRVENVEGARAVGMVAIHHRPGTDLGSALDRLGVLSRSA